MGLFDGLTSLFSGVRSLFGGEVAPATEATLFGGKGELRPGAGFPLFNGEPTTSRLPDSLFDGNGKPIPPDAMTNDGLGHVYTFSSLWNTASATYSWRWDEAYRRSRVDALAMRRDCYLQSLLFERKYPTAQMSWHLEPEDKDDAEQVAVCDYLTDCIDSIPNLEGMLMCLLDGIWYGRAGVQYVWDWKQVAGERSLVPTQWSPVNGDKIQFTWDGIPELMIYSPIADELKRGGMTTEQAREKTAEQLRAAGCEIRMTDRWMVAVLSNPAWRDRLCLYKHDIIDADFFEAEMAGGVHGVGVRHWCYWEWWLHAEIGSYLMDFLQRVGSGFTVYYYDPGNPTAQDSAIEIAKTQGRNSWIVWPRLPGKEGAVPGVERIEPGSGNADVLRGLMEYRDQRIERFIVGQSMSSGEDGSGSLGGTGRANFAKDTKQHIIKADSGRLAGALTTDLVGPLQRYNRPDAKYTIKFVFDVDAADPKARLEAVKSAWEIGVSFDEDEVRALTGMKKPTGDAPILKNPQLAGTEQQPGGAPDGVGVFQGQPAGVFDGQLSNAEDDSDGVFSGQPTAEQMEKEGEPRRYEFSEEDVKRDGDGQFSKQGGGKKGSAKEPKGGTGKSSFAQPLHDAIRSSPGLSDDQRTTYAAAVDRVTARMPKGAQERMASGLKATSFYGDADAMRRGIVESAIDATGKQISPELRKLTTDSLVADLGKRGVGGAFVKGHVHLDGDTMSGVENTRLAAEFGGTEQMLHHVYAHELSHAIDGPDKELSSSHEFVRAWAVEINTLDGPPKLTAYASTDISEGFAEFGRLVYAGDADLKAIEKRFPRTAKFFKGKGLWPKAK